MITIYTGKLCLQLTTYNIGRFKIVSRAMRFYFMKTSKAQMQFCSVGKSTIEARMVSDIVIQSALSKMDTFGTGTKCPS